jgi:N-acetylmuramoyl-L-alanine amidase
MRRAIPRRLLAVAVLLTIAFAAADGANAPETVPVTRLDDVPYVSASDVAHLLSATRFWRSDLRRLSLRAGAHQVQVVVDNPYVLVDDRTVRLDSPVRSLRGEVQLPVSLLDSLPRDSSFARLVYDRRREGVTSVPAGVVSTPRVTTVAGVERWTFPLERCKEITVVGRARGHFRVRFDGYFAGSLPDSPGPSAATRSVRALEVTSGSVLEFALDPDVEGFRLDVREDRAVLEFPRSGEGLEHFAPEGPRGPRSIKIVVIDPGHGGSDAGASAAGRVEKELTLALARVLKPEIERRLRARALLTRDSDVNVSQESRAEMANRVRADVVLSIHFDRGAPGASRGVSAWCAPAVLADEPRSRTAQSSLEVLDWRDAGLRHAVPSRSLADALLSSLDVRGFGPARLYERLPYPLLGVNAPGVLVECGVLPVNGAGSPLDADALESVARAIADGLATWQRND